MQWTTNNFPAEEKPIFEKFLLANGKKKKAAHQKISHPAYKNRKYFAENQMMEEKSLSEYGDKDGTES